MARNKSREKKEFLISRRSKVGPGYLDTPVWIIQKAGKRIWNRRQKRNWRQTDFGQEFAKLKLSNENIKKKCTKKSGKRQKRSKYKIKNKTRNTSIIKK
jgi:hypothetical protein